MKISAQQLRDFEDYCKQIEQITTVNPHQSSKTKNETIKRLKSDYSFFVEYLFPKHAKAKCAWFHVFAAILILNCPVIRLIAEWFRGSAKSTHFGFFIPLWLWINDDLKFMLLIGENETKACKLLSDIQANLTHNQRLKFYFGDQKVIGHWGDGAFRTRSGTYFQALGLTQVARGLKEDGNRPDYILIDDVDSAELSRNPKRIKGMVNEIMDSIMGTFDIGNQRFIFANNNPFVHSILNYLKEEKLKGAKTIPVKTLAQGITAVGAFLYKVKKKWHYLRVNAVDAKGNPSWKEKYSKEYWEDIQDDRSMRSWLREYMNTPSVEDGVFKKDNIQWKTLPALNKYPRLITYCDPSFKDMGDFKACRTWGKIGVELHLRRSFVRQSSRIAMVRWLYDNHESIIKAGAIHTTVIEGGFAQDVLLKDEIYREGLLRGYQLPYYFDERKKGDKFYRIESTSVYYEHGYVFYDIEYQDDADFARGIEQLLAIEQGSKAPDDAPDADEGGIFILEGQARVQQFDRRFGARKQRDY